MSAKNLLSSTAQLGGKNSIQPTTNANVSASSSPSHKDLMSLHDQIKKNRPLNKPGDNYPSSSATNPLMNNPNPMRNMLSTTVNAANQVSAAPLRRPASVSGTTPPQQVLLSSDDEIMDDSLVGK